MVLPPFLITIIGFVLVMALAGLFGGRKREKSIKEYLENELEANSAPKTPIPDEIFYVPDLSALPFKEEYDYDEKNNAKLLECQETVKNKAGLQMLKFAEEQSNNDLKLSFGASNLNNIIVYEVHFSQYMRALLNWGQLLHSLGDEINAAIIFNVCAESGCDMSKPYTILADIYAAQSDTVNLERLLGLAVAADLSTKEKTEEYIRELMNRA